jgi:aspartokinase/homoserine dehydrogenase 1
MDRHDHARPFVVVSAIAGVTDSLIKLANHIDSNCGLASKQINQLEQMHMNFFDELVTSKNSHRIPLKNLFLELRNSIAQDTLRNEHFDLWKDQVLSIGERASALLFAAALTNRGYPAKSYEAYHFIKTDSTFGKAKVQPDLTRKLVRNFLKQSQCIPVITGFIGSDSKHRITTLGRSGSDYTASLVADAIAANHLEIWTDVDGVLSADPRWVPTAESIQKLSFGDIEELSAHGANVIHSKTIKPLKNENTSVLVKNSRNPSHPGTLIESGYKSNGSLKTITVTGPFVSFEINPHLTFNLLKKLKAWLHKETDDEALAYKQNSGFEEGRFVIRQTAYEQIHNRLSKWSDKHNVELRPVRDVFKVKKFSNHFVQGEHIIKRIWNILVSKDLHPLSIEHNQSERFVSFLFPKNEARDAARLLNDYLYENKSIVDLFIAGTGAVGETLLEQLKSIDPETLQYRLLGICNSRKSRWNDRGLNPTNIDWSVAKHTDWNDLLEKLSRPYRHNLIFVDATASEEVARLYPRLLKKGIHVVTPSKLANTFEQSFFDELQDKVDKYNSTFRYETTVGAGLPVISTIRDLKESGDRITKISGVLSGTMTYLFKQLEQGVPFSDAIIQARQKGYAEPDPRDDLSGEDVARKFLTLARTLGLKIERDQLEVESLIPVELQDVDQSTFLDRLHKYDSIWNCRIRTAAERGETLRYTGILEDGKITIGIQSVPRNSSLGQLKGTDNLIQIYSEFYNQTPLVIQGPGAGKEVTAAGVLSDILQTARSLG